MRFRRFRRSAIRPEEMNITAFMNLMVILVPFLLITAVFSRLTIIELNLPPASAAKQEPKQRLQLEVTIREDALEVGDRNSGLIERIARGAQDHDYKRLGQTLQRIKQRFPDKTDATILSEPDTSYETLVKVMDTVRILQVAQVGAVAKYELFPDIAIGDAPSAATRRR